MLIGYGYICSLLKLEVGTKQKILETTYKEVPYKISKLFTFCYQQISSFLRVLDIGPKHLKYFLKC